MSAEGTRGVLAALVCAALGVVPATAGALPAPATSRGARTPRAQAAGSGVSMMVVGAGNVILAQPVSISVAAAVVSTSRGGCAVAGGTPLAALADLRRIGGPPFSIRDYGHCGSSPRDSGQLFVYSIDGESNHGQNGWEYKVSGRSGTAGAADASGPFGNGRLLSPGSKLLWFWCQSVAGGCERTLEVSTPGTVVRAGAISVKVTGYDNEGRGQAMSGARVSIAASAAVTGSSGRVTLRAPSRAGLYNVRASRPGSVPSFPATVQVR